MKLGLSLLGIVAALVVGTYYSLFYNPQNAQQQQMNQVWSQFAREIEALGELVEDAPFNRDERTAAVLPVSVVARALTFLVEPLGDRRQRYVVDHPAENLPQGRELFGMVFEKEPVGGRTQSVGNLVLRRSGRDLR